LLLRTEKKIHPPDLPCPLKSAPDNTNPSLVKTSATFKYREVCSPRPCTRQITALGELESLDKEIKCDVT